MAKGSILADLVSYMRDIQAPTQAVKRAETIGEKYPQILTQFKPDVMAHALTHSGKFRPDYELYLYRPEDFEKLSIPIYIHKTLSGHPDYHTLNINELAGILRGSRNRMTDYAGFNDIPFLTPSEPAEGAFDIIGHEGRHRSRAMAGLGDPFSLVRLYPRHWSTIDKLQDLSSMQVYPESPFGVRSRKPILAKDFFLEKFRVGGRVM